MNRGIGRGQGAACALVGGSQRDGDLGVIRPDVDEAGHAILDRFARGDRARLVEDVAFHGGAGLAGNSGKGASQQGLGESAQGHVRAPVFRWGARRLLMVKNRLASGHLRCPTGAIGGSPWQRVSQMNDTPALQSALFLRVVPHMPGTLFIVTAPSGAGKTTLVHRLLGLDPAVSLSVSYTTRAPRTGERDGHEYHFVDVPRFCALRDEGEFVEWAEVHDNYYATSRTWLTEQTAAGRDILLEIDWQGAQQVRKVFPEAVSIFILPPSLGTLEARLRARGTDDEATISRRLLGARAELRHVSEFDYVIINDNLDIALADLAAVVRASRLVYAKQCRRHAPYFESLEHH